MTRTDLHNITGFHPPTLIAAAAHLRTLIPRGTGGDATALIRQEGRMTGFLEAIDRLMEAASQQPPAAAKQVAQPYSKPAIETPNQK